MPPSFANPSGLWALSLLAPLIALYILKVRRERRRVPSTWLWATAQRDLMARSPFRRLAPQLPLILQALAVIALALALARPMARGQVSVAQHTAVVVDISASMTALDPSGTSRFERARQAARGVIDTLAPDGELMLLAAGAQPRVVLPFERDKKRLRHALDALQPEAVSGDLTTSLALAVERLGSLGGRKRLVLITDGTPPETRTDAEVDIVDVMTPVDNVALTRVDTQLGRAGEREEVQVFVELTSFSQATEQRTVTLRQRNVPRPLATRRVTLAPGETSGVLLLFEASPADVGTGLVIELSPGDALVADDAAFTRVPSGRRQPVVMTPPDAAPWLERALLADRDVELLTLPEDELGKGALPEGALLIATGVCPTASPEGDLLVIAPPPGPCLGIMVEAEVDAPEVTTFSEHDPRFEYVTLDDLTITKSATLLVETPSDALLRSRQGVLMANITVPERSGTLLGFAPASSSWPLRASFVFFVRNIVEQARLHRELGQQRPAKTGTPTRARVPLGASTVSGTAPDGTEFALLAERGVAVLPPAADTGFYYLHWEGARAGSTLVPANLTDATESDTRARSAAGDPRTTSVAGGDHEAADPLTSAAWIAALLALCLVLFDLYWLTRQSRARTLERPRPMWAERGSR